MGSVTHNAHCGVSASSSVSSVGRGKSTYPDSSKLLRAGPSTRGCASECSRAVSAAQSSILPFVEEHMRRPPRFQVPPGSINSCDPSSPSCTLDDAHSMSRAYDSRHLFFHPQHYVERSPRDVSSGQRQVSGAAGDTDDGHDRGFVVVPRKRLCNGALSHTDCEAPSMSMTSEAVSVDASGGTTFNAARYAQTARPSHGVFVDGGQCLLSRYRPRESHHCFKATAMTVGRIQMRHVSVKAEAAASQEEDKKLSLEQHLRNVRSLSPEQIEELLESKEFRKAVSTMGEQIESLETAVDGEASVPMPSNDQLKLYFRDNFIPFMFFGFLDNSIMLLCGDFFDTYFGVAFGISTLTAAALGNIVGDCAGIWLTGTVEAVISLMRFQDPGITFEQRRLAKVQTVKTVGMTSGIFCGCVLGMFPLIWPEDWRLYKSRDEFIEEEMSEIPEQ